MPTLAVQRILDAPTRELKEALAGAIADARALNRGMSITRKRGDAGVYAQRRTYLAWVDAALIDLLKAATLETQLRAQLLTLAKLASPKPMFDNPIVAWEAQMLRDRILRNAGLLDGVGGSSE